MYSPSEMVCPHAIYSAKIGDYIFLQIKVVQLFMSQGSNFVIQCVYFKMLLCLALAFENFALLPATIPTLTSSIVPQLWLHNLPV